MTSYSKKRRPFGKGDASEKSLLAGLDNRKHIKPSTATQPFDQGTHAKKARFLLQVSALAGDQVERAAIFAQAQVHLALAGGAHV